MFSLMSATMRSTWKVLKLSGVSGRSSGFAFKAKESTDWGSIAEEIMDEEGTTPALLLPLHLEDVQSSLRVHHE